MMLIPVAKLAYSIYIHALNSPREEYVDVIQDEETDTTFILLQKGNKRSMEKLANQIQSVLASCVETEVSFNSDAHTMGIVSFVCKIQKTLNLIEIQNVKKAIRKHCFS